MDPWTEFDAMVLRLLSDRQAHDRRDIRRTLARIDRRHVLISLALHVEAGRLVEIRDAVRTSYRITGAGLTHLQQPPSFAKAA